MSRKAILILLMLLSPALAHGQPPEELLTVGMGAFEDGFWKVAEAQWRRFLRLYPDHPLATEVGFLLARTLIHQGRFLEASQVLKKLWAEGTEGGAEVGYWLGFCLAQLGRWKEVIGPLERALEADLPEGLRPSAMLILAEANFRLQRFKGAVPLLKEAIPRLKEPHLSRARLLLGISLYRLGDFQGALRALEGVKGKLAEEALYWRAEAYLEAGRPGEAVRAFRELCLRYPKSAHLPEARYGLALALLQRSQIPEARKVLTSWIGLYKGHALQQKVRLLLGRVLMAEGRFEEAIPVLKKVAKGEGEEAREAHYRLIWCYLQTGKGEEARKLLDRYEDDVTHYFRAELALSKGNCQDALPYLFELMNRKAFRKKALLEIARCSYRLGKFQDCIANLDILKLEFPDFEKIDELLWLKAECLRGAGEEKEAAGLYRLILKRHPSSQRVPWALFRLLDRALERGDLKEAEGYFRRLEASFRDHELTARGALLLGKTLVMAGRWKDAIPKLEKARRSPIKEVKGRALCWLGKAYLRSGSLRKALACFEEATGEGGEMAVLAYVEMGNIMMELGDPEGAKKAYQKAVKLTEDERLRSRVKELLEFAREESE